MKNRTLPSLLTGLVLCTVLALPALAQDNSSSTQNSTPPATATQSSTQSTSQTSSATTASGKQPLQPEAREGFWGRVNPFARKKYVARQTEPIRDRVNELDELTAA